jgi:peptidoglycan/xylan/chitin deacetylase (PgdA/CDA1 family)
MFDLSLSFDNGPEPQVTPAVLDLLAARDIRCTFFLLGRKLVLAGARAVAERARDEGHWIGNHTWSHGLPLGVRPGPQVAEDEIGRTQAELGDLAHPDRLFRPHGGGSVGKQLMSPAVVDYLKDGGFTCVLWNAVPRDYADPLGWVDRALAECASRPWTAMVLHDLPNGAMDHLPRFLDRALAAGARFRQDFPPDCTPILRGQVQGDLSGLVTAA